MHRNMHALSLVPSNPFSTLSDVSSALVCVFCGAFWRFVSQKQVPKSKNQKARIKKQKPKAKKNSLSGYRRIFLFFCPIHTCTPLPTRRDTQKCTKDLDWEPVWEPDGEPADVPDPRLRMGPSSSSPSGVLRSSGRRWVIFSIQTRDVGNQTPNAGFTEEQPQELK